MNIDPSRSPLATYGKRQTTAGTGIYSTAINNARVYRPITSSIQCRLEEDQWTGKVGTPWAGKNKEECLKTKLMNVAKSWKYLGGG